MAAENPKQLIDAGLGTAITCSFAIPEVGPGIAAFLSSGKFVFDLFYPKDESGQDPLQRAPTMADLKNAMSSMETKFAQQLWNNTKTVTQGEVVTMSDAIIQAIRDAGISRKPDEPLPGDTTVWNNGGTIKFFDPVMENPSQLLDVANTIEGMPSDKYHSIGLYTLTVSVYLNYCKTAMVWEINENLKDYKARYALWKQAADNHNFWMLTKSGPEPDKPGPEPAQPTDGDYAVGSAKVNQPTGVMRGARSFLGKKKGEKTSVFAGLAKTEATARTAHLNKIISDWTTGKSDRETYVQGYLSKVTVQTVSVNGDTQYQWVNGVTGNKGDPTPIQGLADGQCEAEQAKLRATYERKWNGANIDPDALTAADIKALKATAAKWQETVDALADITVTPLPT